MHLLQHCHGSRAQQQQQLCSYSSDLELNRCHFTFDYSKKWWRKYKSAKNKSGTWERWRDICFKYDKCVTTGCESCQLPEVVFMPEVWWQTQILSWVAPKQPSPTHLLWRFHTKGVGGGCLSLSLVHTMFPWQQHWQELRLAQAVIRSGNVCGVSSAEMLRSHGVSALSAFGLWLSGWSLLCSAATGKSTLNMSLVRLSHAEEGGGKIGEEGRGGKAPQETNPSSVGGRDANPQWKSVVSVSHTLSVSGSLLSRLTVSFTSVFFFPSLHLYLCTPVP